MDEQGRYDGFSPAAYGAPAPVATGLPGIPAEAVAAAPALRPLSTGEVLDRTFVLYRRRFWLFAGIGMVPAALLTLTSMLRLIFVKAHSTVAAPTVAPADVLAKAMSDAVLMQAYFLPATLLFVLAYGISHAATVHAVLRISTGLFTSAGSAYRAVRGSWLRWVGIAIRQFWSAFWPFLPATVFIMAMTFTLPGAKAKGGLAMVGLLAVLAILCGCAGLVFGVINFLRVALAMPAAVQEQLGVNAAVRRSRVLVAGRKGRIFLLLLLVYVLQIVAGSIQLPLVLIALRTHGAQQILLETIELLVQFVATTLVGPIASIALCLFYIDERVRREGYDIELLMHRSFATPDASETFLGAQPPA